MILIIICSVKKEEKVLFSWNDWFLCILIVVLIIVKLIYCFVEMILNYCVFNIEG